MRRVFKTKTFDRWAKKLLSDDLLLRAAVEIDRGLFEVDLGQGVCKKRIAMPGCGKSGSTRTLVAKKHKKAIFFLVGRQKSDAGSDFSAVEEELAKIVARSLEHADDARLNELLGDGELKEIRDGKEIGTELPSTS